MLKKDNLIFGLVVGVALPIIFAAFAMILLEQIIKMGGGQGSEAPMVRVRTVYLIGLCVNIFLVNYYKKLRYDLSMRGVVIATSILAIGWVIKFGKEIIDQL